MINYSVLLKKEMTNNCIKGYISLKADVPTRELLTYHRMKTETIRSSPNTCPSFSKQEMVRWFRSTAVCLRTAVRTPTQSSYHTIQAIPREFTGSKVSVKDRAQGRIPAVVFSEKFRRSEQGVVRMVERKHLFTTERKQIQSILHSSGQQPDLFYSTKFHFQIRAGSGSSTLLRSGTVLPIKVHRDKETGMVMNLVFVWADEGTELTVDVPIVLKGEEACPGLKNGGSLNKIRNSLKYLCPAEHIPPKIEIDISNLNLGDVILMRDIKVHPSLKLLSKNETMPVCKINKPWDGIPTLKQ